ncbi:hypothetical protein B0H16DRAFT_1445820 [Mycena metata]|uniref:Uncharacterized protein n=1 Tax=Mycena metata TaxID=1033252 RepID=A0AAD7KHN6_9AGAR|nr:hypothetical protein B0H16DRAFT_1445820 [Mycena metata]
MVSLLPVPACGHGPCVRQAENGASIRCPNEPSEPEWFYNFRTTFPTLSELDIAHARLYLITRERNELRSMVAKLSSFSESQIATGAKRKSPRSSGVVAATRDPRKRPRILSPEEEKIASQERRISELEGQLSKAVEESKARRNSDELQLANVRSCLQDLIGKAAANQELILKLEADVERKDKTAQATSAALDGKTRELSAVNATIRKLTDRAKYLERDRKYLKDDIKWYRAKLRDLKSYGELQLFPSSTLKTYHRHDEHKTQVRSSSVAAPDRRVELG